jgi:DNA-binding transcriptional regulator YiaG
MILCQHIFFGGILMDKKNETQFAQMLHKSRLAKGLSRAELSRRINCPLRTLENWEYGERTPPMTTQRLILKEIDAL